MHTKDKNTIVFEAKDRVRINGRTYWYEADVSEGTLTLSAENEFRYEYIYLDLEKYINDWNLREHYRGDETYYIEGNDLNISDWEIADLILFALDNEGNWTNKKHYLLDIEVKSTQELDLEWYRTRFLKIADSVLRKRYPFKKQRKAYTALLWKRHFASWT